MLLHQNEGGHTKEASDPLLQYVPPTHGMGSLSQLREHTKPPGQSSNVEKLFLHNPGRGVATDVVHSYPTGQFIGTLLSNGQYSALTHSTQPKDQLPKYPAIHMQSVIRLARAVRVVELPEQVTCAVMETTQSEHKHAKGHTSL